jgi:hypothetical protein
MTDLLKELEAVVRAYNASNDADAEDKALMLVLTHHADIAEALRDAALWRYLVRENNKGGRGAFRIVWFDEGDDGFITTDGVSVDGKDEQAIIRVVSDAMHNSAREVGE